MGESGGHAHSHHHHHGHAHGAASHGAAFAIGIGLNAAFVAVEAGFGAASHSLSLIADAGHNAGDVLSLAMAWLASWLGRLAPFGRYTYGLRGSSILAALANAILLLLVTGAIAWTALSRLVHPTSAPAGTTMMWVAAAGIVVNGATALLFARGGSTDVNVRGAFLHMAADALVALGVVVAGGLVLVSGARWIDPAMSLVVSAVIVLGTWSLMREALDLALHAVPPGVDRDAVGAYLGGLPGVGAVHDLHIWGMSTTETALTAHLVIEEGADDRGLIGRACAELRARFAVHHATLQLESPPDAVACALAPTEVV